jgi:hypothetical protein
MGGTELFVALYELVMAMKTSVLLFWVMTPYGFADRYLPSDPSFAGSNPFESDGYLRE